SGRLVLALRRHRLDRDLHDRLPVGVRPMSTETSGAEEHAERSVMFYAAIAIFLAILTLIEVAPLFEWFDLPASVLIALSVVKFFFVVAFFMHLWDDASVFTRVFVVPLVGS